MIATQEHTSQHDAAIPFGRRFREWARELVEAESPNDPREPEDVPILWEDTNLGLFLDDVAYDREWPDDGNRTDVWEYLSRWTHGATGMVNHALLETIDQAFMLFRQSELSTRQRLADRRDDIALEVRLLILDLIDYADGDERDVIKAGIRDFLVATVDGVGQRPEERRRRALTDLRRKERVLARTPRGMRNSRLNTFAFHLAPWVRDGVLTADEVEERLTEAALAAGLDLDETRRTFASGFGAGLRKAEL